MEVQYGPDSPFRGMTVEQAVVHVVGDPPGVVSPPVRMVEHLLNGGCQMVGVIDLRAGDM